MSWQRRVGLHLVTAAAGVGFWAVLLGAARFAGSRVAEIGAIRFPVGLVFVLAASLAAHRLIFGAEKK
jgi:hypothetical protein